MSDYGSSLDKAREDFFAEAQELIDGLGRDVLALDARLKQNAPAHELINDVFRGVHTLKGLTGLFGATLMLSVSHELEDVLDDLRLGRLALSPEVLDIVFGAVELYGKLLIAERGQAPEPTGEVRALLNALGNAGVQGADARASPIARYELDPALLGVLTEYEEHRLRAAIESGAHLFKLRVTFSLMSIDTALEDLKQRARTYGEIITYLPSASATSGDDIELEVILASPDSAVTVADALADLSVAVEEIARAQPLPAPPRMGSRLSPTSSLLPPFADLVAPQGIDAPRDSLGPPSLALGASLRSVSQTVRVDIRKLDNLMNIVGELAIVRTSLLEVVERLRLRAGQREIATDLQRLHRAFERHLAKMQGGILEVRMVPLGQAFEKLARIVRQLSREHDKEVNLVVTGAETEIDKLIVEELSDPLMHMIRNSIDHAIESPHERARVGKPAAGTIVVNAYQKGNQVVIEVEDDGRGIDEDRVVASALRLGMITHDEARDLPRRDILSLLFRPGLTTRDAAGDTSGRGVGMDVVKTNIAKLGGIIDVSGESGIGTKITITMPITLAIIRVLMVSVAGRIYAVPLPAIEEAIAFDERLVRAYDGREVLTQRGATLPICRLRKLFGHDAAPALPTEPRGRAGFVVIASVGGRRAGFVVDKLLAHQDIVIKSLGKTLRGVRGFAGAAELGDQRVGLVVDMAQLIDDALDYSGVHHQPAGALS